MSVKHARSFVLLGTALLIVGCTGAVVVRDPAPPAVSRAAPSTAATLGIPPGHLPPPGQCKVWIPGLPPGQQAKRARACGAVLAAAPAGSWILYRPTRDKKVVYVREVDGRRAGVIVRVRVFEVSSGKFVREEKVKADAG